MLTDAKIKTAKPKEKTYRLTDQQGLCLEIKPTGVKVWRYRFMIDGQSTMLSLGEYPMVTLSTARTLHQTARAQVKQGINPIEQKRELKQQQNALQPNTFKQLSEEWFKTRMHSRSTRYQTQIQNAMNTHIYPVIGDLAINSITSADVIKILNKTMTHVAKHSQQKASGKSTAINHRQWISAVFNYAIQTLRADADPTVALRRTIQRDDVQHAEALTLPELTRLVPLLDNYQGTAVVKHAIQLMQLTMVRSAEVRHAKWSDIDFDNQLWTIPKEMMKKRRLHVVPLSTQAIKILKAQRDVSAEFGVSEWCFPSPKNHVNTLGSTTINHALAYMGMSGTTGHDFRATASTILNTHGFNPDWIETQLAHADENQSRRAYNHADYLADRKVMMQWWADFLGGLTNVANSS